MTGKRSSTVSAWLAFAARVVHPALLPLFTGLLAGITSVVIGVRTVPSATAPGTDGSYIWAYNESSARLAWWGHEFLATFGPYGYVVNGIDVGSLYGRIVGFELALALLGALAVTGYVFTVPGLQPAARVTGVMVLVHAFHIPRVLGPEYRWVALVLLLALWGLHAAGPGGWVGRVGAAAVAGFSLLVKFTVGLSALLTVAAATAAGSTFPPRYGRLVAVAVALGGGIALGWVGHYGTLSGLADYFVTAGPVAGGYSSAMSLAPAGWQLEVACILAFYGVLGLLAVAIPGRLRRTLTVCAAPLMVGWKHAVVRQDGHVQLMVLFALLVVAIVTLEGWSSRRRTLALLGAAGAALMLVLASVAPNPLKLAVLPGALAPSVQPSVPRAATAAYSRMLLDRQRLPPGARALLGDEPVDVYPWELVFVPANDLRWAGRPSPASFATYTPTLDAMNAAFFESPRRPHFLIWHETALSIDGRHIFWDEPRTLVTMLNHYARVPGTLPSILRLRPAPRFAARERLGESVRVPWRAWTPVPDAPGAPGVIVAEIAIRRPWTAWLRRWALREDPMYITARFQTGDEHVYRFVPDQAASGLWISPLPRDTVEMRSALNGRLATRVTAIRFHGAWGRPSAPPLGLQWWRLVPAESPVPDTVAVFRPRDGVFDLPDDRGLRTWRVPFARRGDVPLAGDWTGDGRTKLGVFRPSEATFYLSADPRPGAQPLAVQLGRPGDIPVVGDWSGEGTTTIGVFRPSTATFYLRDSNNPGAATRRIPHGSPGDVPVVGDWTGRGVAAVGVYRPQEGVFALRLTNDQSSVSLVVPFGAPGDTPIVGDWSGGGVTRIGVYRPRERRLYLAGANAPGAPSRIIDFGELGASGQADDVPVAARWRTSGDPGPRSAESK